MNAVVIKWMWKSLSKPILVKAIFWQKMLKTMVTWLWTLQRDVNVGWLPSIQNVIRWLWGLVVGTSKLVVNNAGDINRYCHNFEWLQCDQSQVKDYLWLEGLSYGFFLILMKNIVKISSHWWSFEPDREEMNGMRK